MWIVNEVLGRVIILISSLELGGLLASLASHWRSSLGSKILVSKCFSSSFFIQLRQWGQDKMPKYLIPSEIMIMSEIPKNHMGKVNKKSLVKQAFPNNWFDDISASEKYIKYQGEQFKIQGVLQNCLHENVSSLVTKHIFYLHSVQGLNLKLGIQTIDQKFRLTLSHISYQNYQISYRKNIQYWHFLKTLICQVCKYIIT